MLRNTFTLDGLECIVMARHLSGFYGHILIRGTQKLLKTKYWVLTGKVFPPSRNQIPSTESRLGDMTGADRRVNSFKIYFVVYAMTVVPIFPPLPPSTQYPPSSSNPFLYFMSMGHACKFFGFSISYTIPNIPLSILFLPIMLLNPCTFYPILPTSWDTRNSLVSQLTAQREPHLRQVVDLAFWVQPGSPAGGLAPALSGSFHF